MKRKWYRPLLAVLLCALTVVVFALRTENSTVYALSKIGSRGTEVKAIQEKLKERGLYNGSVDEMCIRDSTYPVHHLPKSNIKLQ